MLEQKIIPQPLFAGPESMIWREEDYFATYPCVHSYLSAFPAQIDVVRDFRSARLYLSIHNQTQGTYGNYRGFVERLLLFSWICAQKSALELKRQDIAEFVGFCKKPPPDWVGDAPRARFIGSDGEWCSNPDWRPLDVRSQVKSQTFESNFQAAAYQPFKGTTRQLLSVCSSFYSFLHREGLSEANPIVAAKPQQGRAFHRGQPTRNVVSPQCLDLIMRQLEQHAVSSPDGERTLFIIAAALYLYLRPSDLASTNETCPTMEVFRLEDGKWWLILEARNPPLKIPVGQEFLRYLVRYRVSRGLSPLPVPDEQEPMLETVHGRAGLSARRIKQIVKNDLAKVHRQLETAGYSEVDLEVIKSVSLRWFRDSGARRDARVRAPADLQRGLGNVSVAYVYGRYYVE
ncbi:site specific recombinase, phage integrase [Pseudomonas chlororaphis subsp. aureofaciens]|uniref:integrase n=1 Tax=Pseudomonas chlororaphis TaxID=587753 RepID=UPI000F6B6F54|nr:integrase [Pseudomonas chlororaphis]AZE11431.1 site specific recombinase, phage integrase [Pseudomonas chlororaphis subsp. aureofaciens]